MTIRESVEVLRRESVRHTGTMREAIDIAVGLMTNYIARRDRKECARGPRRAASAAIYAAGAAIAVALLAWMGAMELSSADRYAAAYERGWAQGE